MHIDTILKWLRSQPPISHETDMTRAGATVRHTHRDGERYAVDFADGIHMGDEPKPGLVWAQQFDTSQDAAYFGVWFLPELLCQITYCEGDWELVECPNAEVYNAIVRLTIAFYAEGRICLVLPHDGSQATEIRQSREMFFLGGSSMHAETMKAVKAAAPGEWVRTDSETYAMMLGCVPPAWMCGGYFACGEAHHHNERWEPVYICFREKDERYYARLATIDEVRRELEQTHA